MMRYIALDQYLAGLISRSSPLVGGDRDSGDCFKLNQTDSGQAVPSNLESAGLVENKRSKICCRSSSFLFFTLNFKERRNFILNPPYLQIAPFIIFSTWQGILLNYSLISVFSFFLFPSYFLFVCFCLLRDYSYIVTD